MFKCAGLYTSELDSPELALSQIRTQLSEKIELMEHSVGVITCHKEFVDSGVLRHIAENLPFKVAGATTTAAAVNDMVGEVALAIFVMTSDTVRFKVGMTESMETEIEGPLRAAIEQAGEGSERPKLALAFPPLILQSSGDDMMEIWDRILPGVPVFGTVAVDDSSDLSGGVTIYGSETAKTCHPFILCYGDINPRFLIATLPESNELPYKGVITRSNANTVYEIDGRSAHEFLKRAGITSKGESAGVGLFVPFSVNPQNRKDADGMPVLRGVASITDEGPVIFRGRMDENSSVSLLTMSAEDVIAATEAKLRTIRDMPDVKGVLVLSCVVRHLLVIHDNPLEELEHSQEALKGVTEDPPFMMCYAGGEFCPTSVKDGVHVNRFHNYTLVALVL